MTPKELLYIEDVLGHQKQMKTAFADFAGQISDPELKNFVQNLSDRQNTQFQKFYSLVNGQEAKNGRQNNYDRYFKWG